MIRLIEYSVTGLVFFQMAILIGVAGWQVWRSRRQGTRLEKTHWRFQLYHLVIIVVLSWMVYLALGFVRIFAPHLILCLCFLILMRSYKTLLFLTLLNMAFFWSFERAYHYNVLSLELDQEQVQIWREEAARPLSYQADAPDGWCNTILVDLPLYDAPITFLPPAFGISWMQNDALTPSRSRYYYLSAPPDADLDLREITTFFVWRYAL